MSEHILFLTGHLACNSLGRELEGLKNRRFSYDIRDLGLQVAALMTADMIKRRLDNSGIADRIIVPGLCSGNVEALTEHFGIPVLKGPKDLKDLPEFFGTQGRQIDLSQHAVTIFAEIVDAPERSIESIIERAQAYRRDGADVIDLGCLPATPFPHLAESIQALHEQGFKVSVDSLDEQDLLCAGKAGADYLLSLKESTLWLADEVASTPILIPENSHDLHSLYRAVQTLEKNQRAYFADAILEPIHFGFTASIIRYHELRKHLPEAPIMMGIGNVTELTDADSTGTTALLLGIISELGIGAVLTTEVSPHCRSVVRETDLARRMMYAAKQDERLPRGYHAGLMALRDRKPFPYSSEEIATTARAIKDPSFRIQVSEQGIHIYNRDGLHTANDPYDLFPLLNVNDDGAHAFYLGVELAHAQTAWQLGKRYLQDNALSWGCTVIPQAPDNQEGYQKAGTTLQSKTKKP